MAEPLIPREPVPPPPLPHKLVLDHRNVLQLLGHESLYCACPEFLYLRRDGLEAWRLQSTMERVKLEAGPAATELPALPVGTGRVQEHLADVVDRFLTFVGDIYRLDPHLTDSLLTYVVALLGRPLDHLLVPVPWKGQIVLLDLVPAEVRLSWEEVVARNAVPAKDGMDAGKLRRDHGGGDSP
jgi:hypothetical protein